MQSGQTILALSPAELSSQSDYASTQEAERLLGVKRDTLYRWAKNGWIEHYKTPAGVYRWDCATYLRRKRAVIQPDKTATRPNR
jgi:excisionase family DNA binding protein